MFLDITRILEQLATLLKLDREYGSELQGRLPEIVGGLILCLAKTFKIIGA